VFKRRGKRLNEASIYFFEIQEKPKGNHWLLWHLQEQATAPYKLVVQYKEMSYPGVALLHLQYPVAANKIPSTFHMKISSKKNV
jgi:hypothetical protein